MWGTRRKLIGKPCTGIKDAVGQERMCGKDVGSAGVHPEARQLGAQMAPAWAHCHGGLAVHHWLQVPLLLQDFHWLRSILRRRRQPGALLVMGAPIWWRGVCAALAESITPSRAPSPTPCHLLPPHSISKSWQLDLQVISQHKQSLTVQSASP